MPYLEHDDGAGGVRRVDLGEGPVLLGRKVDCDVRLNGPVVSRHHCRLLRQDGRWRIEDLASRHGTFLNRLPVKGLGDLSDGDRITIGEHVLTFKAGPLPDRSTLPVDEGLGPSSSGRGITITGDYTLPKDLPGRVFLEQSLRSAPDLEELFRKAVELAMEATGANRGVLAVRKGDSFRRRVQLVGAARQPPDRDIAISESFVGLLVRSRKPTISRDTDHDRELSVSASVLNVDIRSILGAPLLLGDELLGYLYLDTLGERGNVRGRIFRREDLSRVTEIAVLAAEEIERRGAG